ncbi:unnamed protein product [Lactuca virosa]|uniref:Uncharacterized protein n=1 Tax=Lactuca virosa TaxID=75947 RepID=A0AAU9PQ33_9ASTR|nr:unnamed protein product [Lactuca virosa]
MGDTQRIVKRRRVYEAHNSGIDPDNDAEEEEDDDDTHHDSNVVDKPHRYGDNRPYLKKFALVFFKHKYYRWDSLNEGMIENGVKSVVQDCYLDIMSEYRHEYANRARAAGHNIADTNNDIAIMRHFEPITFNEDVWKDLCKYWDTDAWRKNSAAGRTNRMSNDNTGTISSHTGGSRGYDQYRLELERHTSVMVEKYREDLTRHLEGDVDLWVQAQEGRGKCRCIYGVGCPDLHFVVTGTSSNENKPTSSDYQQSHQQVWELEQAHAANKMVKWPKDKHK